MSYSISHWVKTMIARFHQITIVPINSWKTVTTINNYHKSNANLQQALYIIQAINSLDKKALYSSQIESFFQSMILTELWIVIKSGHGCKKPTELSFMFAKNYYISKDNHHRNQMHYKIGKSCRMLSENVFLVYPTTS